MIKILNMYSIKLALLTCILIDVIPCSAQVLKTKDGISMGERSEFIAICTAGMDEYVADGLELESYKYCACVCDNLIPTINSWEFSRAMKEDRLMDLFQEDGRSEIVANCVGGNVEINGDYRFDSFENSERQSNVAIQACIEEIMNDEAMNNEFSEVLAYEYCECATIKLFTAGYTYNDLLEIEDENSETFNEIVVPCLNEVMNNKAEFNSSNLYNVDDIGGGDYRSLVPLTDYLGLGYKVKITISGVTKYYLLDTGSSDLLIDRETERELLLNGDLKRENYLSKTAYTLANNQTVQGQEVKIDNITIGDYTVNNVVISIVDEGSLLCGISFLDKFKKWELDKQNKVLILYK